MENEERRTGTLAGALPGHIMSVEVEKKAGSFLTLPFRLQKSVVITYSTTSFSHMLRGQIIQNLGEAECSVLAF